MSNGKKIAPWVWREAIRHAPKSVRPLTRLLCQTLSDFMDYDDISAGCFPNVKTLMRATGLSNRAVADHIEAARAAGLLIVEREIGRDGRFKSNTYLPRFPAGSPVSAAHPAPCEAGSPGPSEAEAANRVKRTSRNRVSAAHAYLSTSTDPSTEARSRAMKDDFDDLIAAGWKRVLRHSPEFDGWHRDVDKRDRALGDRMRCQDVFCIYVPDYRPWPGCPLPKLYLPNRADGSSAGKGSERPRSKAKSDA